MAENVFLKECNVKKTNQYDALDVLKDFKLGTPLYLFREPEDIKETVFLYYKENKNDENDKNENENDKDKKNNENNENENDKDKDKKNDENRYRKIGIISEEDEDPIDKFLKASQKVTNIEEQGTNELLFECKVSSIDTDADTDADEDKRIKVAIFIKKK